MYGLKTILALIAVMAAAATVAAQRGPIQIGVVDLGNNVYQLTGGSNAVLAVGTDGAILVDSKFREPEALVRKVAEVTAQPVRVVINTHSHPDHVGANEPFRRQGANVLSTARAAAWMARPFLAPNGNMDPPLAEGGRPNQTFTGRRTVTVGSQRAEAIEVTADAHSSGDAYVHFPAANVIVMGDLHHSNEYPVYDADMGCLCGSYEENLKAYDAMLALGNDQTKYIPGHRAVTTKAEVTAYVAMLRATRTRVQRLIDQGRTAEDVVALKLLADDKSPNSPGPDNRDSFIRVLYDALKTGKGR